MAGANRSPIRILAVAGSVAALAACATPPPPPPPPPPPVVQAVPYRPLPPSGAAYAMNIPRPDATGIRQTVNANLTEDEMIWHVRSGWNVAALNCTGPLYQPILDGYGSYINGNKGALSGVNSRRDGVYRERAGTRRGGIMLRETRLTSVYNYFALPPARSQFCRTMLQIAQETQTTPVTDVVMFSAQALPRMEAAFETFFTAYEQYERESAAWDSTYGARYGSSQPGYVAVQRARMSTSPDATAGIDTLAVPPSAIGEVTDPDTGVNVPIIEVDEGFSSTPVVEPVAEGGAE